MITIAEILGIIDRFKRDPVGAGSDYARGAARAIPEGVASLLDLARYPGMGSMREGLDSMLLGSPLASTGTNTDEAGALVGFPGIGTALKGIGLLGAIKSAGTAFPAAGALLGRYPSTTPGRIVNKTNATGGYSVNLPSGQIPTEGLMMGKFANTDPRNMVVDALRRADVERHAGTNANVLDRPDSYLGTWRDPDTGRTYLDVSQRFGPDDIRPATKYGERTGQLAGYDVGAGKQFPVGNWRGFVRSPEFAQRMTEMEAEGANYLKQFPAHQGGAQWWDMHGSPFERVYGSHHMPQTAGFTASTAPNTAPREDLQTMSEYMRRLIKDEPIIQPEWRVPAGEMTRKEGVRIGMEQSRAANLQKSAAGDLDALRLDKVREEAEALMGDPSAVVLDRHWARLAEDPSRGVFTASKEGLITAGKDYAVLKDAITESAKAAGMAPRDYSAHVWTGIREHIKNNGNLYGQKFRGSAITGDSKSYADHFEHLIADKANHLGITVAEMEARLRRGDATLMSALLATPLIASIYGAASEEGYFD